MLWSQLLNAPFVPFFPSCLTPPSLPYLWDQPRSSPFLHLSATEGLEPSALSIIPLLCCHLPLLRLLHFAPQGRYLPNSCTVGVFDYWLG